MISLLLDSSFGACTTIVLPNNPTERLAEGIWDAQALRRGSISNVLLLSNPYSASFLHHFPGNPIIWVYPHLRKYPCAREPVVYWIFGRMQSIRMIRVSSAKRTWQCESQRQFIPPKSVATRLPSRKGQFMAVWFWSKLPCSPAREPSPFVTCGAQGWLPASFNMVFGHQFLDTLSSFLVCSLSSSGLAKPQLGLWLCTNQYV